MSEPELGSNIQNLRNRIKFSLETCEKVLDDFSNLTFLSDTLQTCEKDCYEKYNKIYMENEKNEFFNFRGIKNEFVECTNKCEEIYKKVMHHQIKGAEISYVKT
jgi:hypothetical protein